LHEHPKHKIQWALLASNDREFQDTTNHMFVSLAMKDKWRKSHEKLSQLKLVTEKLASLATAKHHNQLELKILES
jgi:hypothetical protein